MDCMEVITAEQFASALTEVSVSFVIAFCVALVSLQIWTIVFDRSGAPDLFEKFWRYVSPRALARRRVRVDGRLKKYREYPSGYIHDLAFDVENDSIKLELLADELDSLAEKARADGFDYVAEQLTAKAAEGRVLAVDAREVAAFRCARLEKGRA